MKYVILEISGSDLSSKVRQYRELCNQVCSDSDSDWDIGIEGMPSSAFFPALNELMDLMNRKVDLVELDDGSRFSGFLKQWENLVRVA